MTAIRYKQYQQAHLHFEILSTRNYSKIIVYPFAQFYPLHRFYLIDSSLTFFWFKLRWKSVFNIFSSLKLIRFSLQDDI